MKIVARIPYQAISPLELAELERYEKQGCAFQLFLDAQTERVLVIVPDRA
jgi:hypothetical protein